MATIATSLNISTRRAIITSKTRQQVHLAGPVRLNSSWNLGSRTMKVKLTPVRAKPEGGISEKVEKSIKDAEETCADDPVSGECVAAWDEVEELSAAASHARDKKKAAGSDPLEEYCKDNPETDECRTYDN